MRARLILLGVVALVAGVVVFYWGYLPDVAAMASRLNFTAPLPPPAPVPPISVVAAVVRAEDVPIYLSGIGTVQAYNTVSVKSRVDGTITQILFAEGQDVKVGDPLAIIDPRPFEAQLDQQQAMLRKDEALLEGALLDLRRFEALVQRNYASQQSVDQQRAVVAQARAQILSDEAQIRLAKTQLDYTRITAPIGGRTGIRLMDAGNMVRATDSTIIVVIAQLQPISVVFTLSASAVGQARIGLGATKIPVAAFAEDDTTKLDEGTVELVDNQVDQATGTVKLKATFPNAALRLWPGNFVNGRLTVETHRDGLTLPSVAVRHGPRGDFVWVIKPDRTVEFRSVTLGQAFAGRSQILRGVNKGEQAVVDGYFRLETGSRVEIVRIQNDSPQTPGAG
jgi:multidrug efflux system membrane fusion protein